MTARTRALDEAADSLSAARVKLDLILSDPDAPREVTAERLLEIGRRITDARGALARLESEGGS